MATPQAITAPLTYIALSPPSQWGLIDMKIRAYEKQHASNMSSVVHITMLLIHLFDPSAKHNLAVFT